ncbi:MAG: peptidoglycan-binding domain-containing protein [Acidimicrobiales bacterium]
MRRFAVIALLAALPAVLVIAAPPSPGAAPPAPPSGGAVAARPDPSRPVSAGPGAGCWRKPATYHTGMTGPVGTSARVRSAVIGYQRLLIARGFLQADPDTLGGTYGPLTRDAVKALQADIGEAVDGRLGREESLALFKPYVEWFEAAYGVPGRSLWGLLNEEGCGDYGAEGVADPSDRGPFQWNRSYFHDCATRCETYMPDGVAWGRPFTIYGTAESIAYQLQVAAGRWRRNYDRYRYGQDFNCSPHHCRAAAILFHARPAEAEKYAGTGAVPSFDAALYVELVKSFASGAPPSGAIEFGSGYPCPLARWTYADGTDNPCAWTEEPEVPVPA